MWHRSLLVVLGIAVATSAAASELTEAARTDDIAAVRRLLAARVNVNEPGGDGTTALHWAAYNDAGETARLLIGAGADVRAVTRNGALTPLMLAATHGSASVVEALLAAGADPHARTTDGATPLMTAAASGSADAVRLLLKHGAEVNATDTAQGQTALMFAAAANRAAVIRELLGSGATAGAHVEARQARESELRGGRRRRGAGTEARAIALPRPGPNDGQGPGRWAAWRRCTLRRGTAGWTRPACSSRVELGRSSPPTRIATTPLVIAASNGHYELAKIFPRQGRGSQARQRGRPYGVVRGHRNASMRRRRGRRPARPSRSR